MTVGSEHSATRKNFYLRLEKECFASTKVIRTLDQRAVHTLLLVRSHCVKFIFDALPLKLLVSKWSLL